MSSPNDVIAVVVFEKLTFKLFCAGGGVSGKLIDANGDSLNAGWKLIGTVGGGLNVGGCWGWKGSGGGGSRLLLLLLLLLLELKDAGLFFNAFSRLCIPMSTVLRPFFIKVLAWKSAIKVHEKLKCP